MAIELFKPQFRTIQSPINLDVLANTYNTLEKGHQAAVDSTAAYITALGDLPVNEQERPYIQQHINTIQSAFNDSKVYGNAAGFLDDVKLLATKISSDPGLRGRIKAQADYQIYLDNLNKRTDISEADKEYFREVNQYYYQDNYDKFGNIVGGTNWTPIDREVSAPDTVKMMDQALKMVAAEGGRSNTIYYKAADGSYTTNAKLSADNIPYYSVQGEYQRVSKDKLRQALNTVIANTDGAIEGLQQDYKIAKWRHNKSEGLTVDETTDDKGLPLNFEQYLEKRFNGFYHTASYSRYYENSLTPLAGLKQEAEKNSTKAKTGKASLNWKDLLDMTITTTPGAYRQERKFALAATVSGYTAAAEKLRSMADKIEIQWNPDDMKANYDNIAKYYGGVPPKIIYDAYKEYTYNINKFNQVMPKGNIDRESIIFSSNLLTGVDMSQIKGNKYADEYIKLVSDIYKDGNLIIPVADTLENKISDLDYESLGLELKYDKNGQMYFESDISDSNDLYNIAIATKPYRIFTNLQVGAGPGEFTPMYYGQGNYLALDKVINLYNNSIKSVEPILNESIYVPTEKVSEMDLIETLAAYNYSNGNYTDIENAKSAAQDALRANISGIYGPRAGLSIGWGNNPITDELTTEQQFAVGELIKYAAAEFKNDYSLFGIGYDKGTGHTMIDIAMTPEFKNSPVVLDYLKLLGAEDANNLNIMATNIWNNEIKNQLLNTPEYAISAEFSSDVYSGVTNWDLESGGKVVKVGDEYYNDYKGIYYPLGDYFGAKAAVATNKLMSDMKYTDLVEKAKGNKYDKNIINTLRLVIAQDILPNCFPGISPTTTEGSVLIENVVNSIINQN